MNGRDTAQSGTLTYGPSFYRTARFLVSDDPQDSVLRIRLFNAALATVLLVMALLVSYGPVRVALACGWLLGMVPLGLFYVPSTNPVSWTITGIGVLWAFVFTWLTADHWNSLKAWIALTGAIVAILLVGPTRRDGWLSILITLAACLILTHRHRERSSTRWWLVLGTLIVVTAWTSRPTATYTEGLLEGRGGVGPNSGGQGEDPLSSVATIVREVAAFPKAVLAVAGGNVRGETFSAIGLNDVHLPLLVPLGMLIAALLLLKWAWMWHPRMKTLAFVWVLGALVTMVLSHKVLIAVEYAIQPRHLVPLLIVVLGISLITPPTERLSPRVGIAAAVAISSAASAALIVTQARHAGSLLSNVTGAPEWWWRDSIPWGPSTNVVFGTMFTCGWVVSVVTLALRAAACESRSVGALSDRPMSLQAGFDG